MSGRDGARYRVGDAWCPSGWGRTFYVGSDAAEAWHVYRCRTAVEPLTGSRGVVLSSWDPAGIGRWVTVRQVLPGRAGA